MARKKQTPDTEETQTTPPADTQEAAGETPPNAPPVGSSIDDVLPPAPAQEETPPEAAQATATIDDVLASDKPPELPGLEQGPPPAESAPAKNRGGRPKGSKNKTPQRAGQGGGTAVAGPVAQPSVDPAVLAKSFEMPIAQTFQGISEFVARFRGPHWRFNYETESIRLGEVWAPVVAPLLADNPNAILWAAAISTTVGVVGPRLDIDRQAAAGKTEGAE